MIKAALYNYLIGDSGVSALIADRVYPLLIPQQAWSGSSVQPCAVYQRTSVQRDVRHCGTSGLALSTMQIDAYATDYEAADAVARVIKDALINYYGPMGDVDIKSITLAAEFDLLDPEPGLFRVSLSFFIWHTGE